MRGLTRLLGECGTFWQNPHGRHFFVAMFLWSFSTVLGDTVAVLVSGPVGTVAALLPLVPAGWAMWSLALYVRSVDELERRKFVEALTFAFTVTFLAAVLGARLEIVSGSQLRAQELMAVMLLSSVVGYSIAAWRYR